MNIRIAVILKDNELSLRITRQLSETGNFIEPIYADEHVWQNILRCGADMIIMDEDIIPAPLEKHMQLLNELPEQPTTIIFTSSDSPEEHAKLLECSCDTVLYIGLDPNLLIGAIDSAIQIRSQATNFVYSSQHQLLTNRTMLSDFETQTPEMQMFMQTVERIKNSKTTLLILGETGVGKEHLSRAIHNESSRSEGPFIPVNLAAIPEQLLESELFGHEAGAFTGAIRGRRGAFELAHKGTIFLDEIGEIPLHIQAKLLRVLQDFEIRRVGAENSVQIDTRVIAATNKNLKEEMEANRFRQDLYYRLSVISLTIPPLRQRRADISSLAQRFLNQLKLSINSSVKYINNDVLACLKQYNWPGNIRELKNVLERAILLCDDEKIAIKDLPDGISKFQKGFPFSILNSGQIPADWSKMTLPEVSKIVIESVEKTYLEKVLDQAKGRVGLAAESSGIHIRSFYNKMKKYNLDKKKYKST